MARDEVTLAHIDPPPRELKLTPQVFPGHARHSACYKSRRRSGGEYPARTTMQGKTTTKDIDIRSRITPCDSQCSFLFSLSHRLRKTACSRTSPLMATTSAR